MKNIQIILLALLTVLATSCGNEFSRPDTTGHEVRLSVRPFYRDMFAGGNTHELVKKLSADYGKYFDTYCLQEIRIGQPTDPDFELNFGRFLSYDENNEVIATCDSVWDKLDIDDELSDAFSCFGALFPSAPVPQQVLCHFSGFNDKIFVDSTYISFSIEHYLGPNCRFYDWLEIPRYAQRTRTPDYIASDLIKGWIMACLPEMSGKEDVLTAIIYRAKVLYATHACMPSIDLQTLFGFTDKQLTWCEKNESRMWAYMASHKLLYSTNQLDRNKLANEAPYTAFFGNESPGRAATYCAYQIVRKYMSEKKVPVEMLMNTHDAQSILREAHYNP